MCRALVLAISVSAFALAGCAAGPSDTASGLPFAGAETVGDAAAIVAHRPTDSQNTAAAIEAVGALGSRLNQLADESATEPAGWTDPRLSSGACRDGTEFFAPDRAGQPESTETREYFDVACTQLARDTVRRYYVRSPTSEVVARATELYTRGLARPIATRRETVTISGATFARFGFPSAARGFTRTSVGVLWIGERRQNASASSVTLLPGRGGANLYCRAAAAYSLTGVPSLDATFGWDGSTVGGAVAATRQSDARGNVTLASLQRGNAYAGPIGSLRLTTLKAGGACPTGGWAFRVAGGVPATDFSLPIRATYRNGALASLSVAGASLGTYRLTASTVGSGLDDRNVAGVLVSRGVRVASLQADAFGNGLLTVTSTGAQYRLIDWTIVR